MSRAKRCLDCSRKAGKGRARCRQCAERKAAYLRERRAAKRRFGECYWCAESAAPGYVLCEAHHEAMLARRPSGQGGDVDL